MGLLYSYIFNRWANINSLATGAAAGAIIALLLTAPIDLTIYATLNISNLTATVVDILAGAVMGAIVGGAVGMTNGMGKKKWFKCPFNSN